MKHFNYNYSAGQPIAIGDRYFSQDAVADFRYHEKSNGDIMSALTGSVNAILSGLVVTQGTGLTLNITAGKALIKKTMTIPDNSGGWTIPAASTTQDIYYITEILSDLSSTTPTGSITQDGITVNYVKLAYAESDGQTRTRAKAAGSYVFEKGQSYTLTWGTAAPTAYEIELTRFTCTAGIGGTMTFDNTNRVAFKIQGKSSSIIIASSTTPQSERANADYVLSGADVGSSINSIITALNTAGGGKITFLEGTYLIQTTILPLSNIDIVGQGHSTIFKRNALTLLDVFYISNGKTNISLRDFYIDGNGSSFAPTSNSSGINCQSAMNYLSFYNITVSNGTAGGASIAYGIMNAINVFNCVITNLSGTASSGFYGCQNLNSCSVVSMTGSAYSSCLFLTNCRAISISSTTATAFISCNYLSNCYSNLTTGTAGAANGFYQCTTLTNCYATGTNASGANASGFNDCDDVVNCVSNSNTGSVGGNGYGFFQCNGVYKCVASGNTGGTPYGFKTCYVDHAVAAPINQAVAANNDAAAYGWNFGTGN